MKIGIARYPYFQQSLKGGDYVLFDAVAAALSEKHAVEFLEYRRPGSGLFRHLPTLLRKLCVRLVDLALPFFYTRQLQARSREYDLILADSAVITSLSAGKGTSKKLLALINIDYREYLTAVGQHIPFHARMEMRWKAWMQEQGIKSHPTICVSNFVRDAAQSRGLKIARVIENQIQDLPESFEKVSSADGLVYAGSGDYWGKGLDVLEELSVKGMEIHTYSPASVERCINHGPVGRATLLSELPRYQLMIFPSRYESFGLVAVEAMAMGIPVVMRRTGVGLDLAQVVPECVVPDNPTIDDWTNAIKTVVANRESIMVNANRFALGYLDREKFSTQWREAIDEISVENS